MKNPGDINNHHQRLVRKTDQPGNHPTSHIWVLACDRCGHEYGPNGFDAHERRCPHCGGGKPGLNIS
jgi:ribosomal protein L37E